MQRRYGQTHTQTSFRPIAIFLIGDDQGDSLSLRVHQVIPEDPRSIAKFIERATAGHSHPRASTASASASASIGIRRVSREPPPGGSRGGAPALVELCSGGGARDHAPAHRAGASSQVPAPREKGPREKGRLHHVVVFTQMTYAECQSEIRRIVAARSGATLRLRGGGCKEIDGDPARIRAAMDELALDSSAISGIVDEEEDDSEEDEEDDEGENDDDDSEEEGDEDDAAFIDDEASMECDEMLEDTDDEREISPEPEPPNVLRRLRRGAP